MVQKPLCSDDPDDLPRKTLITFSCRRRNKTNPEAAAHHKLQNLIKTLNPVPFVPSKTLDLQRHEDLLKRLGLWDFAHIQFDQTLQTDRIAELIINYCPQGRCSYVGEARVMVSRADLARALKLPVEKKNVGRDDEVVESIGFVEDLVGKWVLLKEEDMWS